MRPPPSKARMRCGCSDSSRSSPVSAALRWASRRPARRRAIRRPAASPTPVVSTPTRPVQKLSAPPGGGGPRPARPARAVMAAATSDRAAPSANRLEPPNTAAAAAGAKHQTASGPERPPTSRLAATAQPPHRPSRMARRRGVSRRCRAKPETPGAAPIRKARAQVQGAPRNPARTNARQSSTAPVQAPCHSRTSRSSSVGRDLSASRRALSFVTLWSGQNPQGKHYPPDRHG